MRRWTWWLLVAIVAVIVVSTTTFESPTRTTSYWHPSASASFQIILSNPPSPAQRRGPFSVIEIDGNDATVSDVAALHQLGKKVVCYVDVGTWENWRPDAHQFPADVLGKADVGWSGERWLDIRQQSILLPIMRARFAMCEHKGFDAVDPDNVDGYENPTGFPLTRDEQLSYDRAIAAIAHHDHLAVALKSFANGATALEPYFDFVVDEQCVQYAECSAFNTFVVHDKPVFDIEYTTNRAFCRSLPRGVSGIAKHLALDAWVLRCP